MSAEAKEVTATSSMPAWMSWTQDLVQAFESFAIFFFLARQGTYGGRSLNVIVITMLTT